MIGILAMIGAAVGTPAAAPVVSAPVQAEVPLGIYGNVKLSPQTDDLSGYELQLFRRGNALMVEVVLCEGSCSETYTVPARREGSAVVFDFQEDVVDQDGKPVAGARFHMRLVPLPGAVVLTDWIDGKRASAHPMRLKRLREPFGLALARESWADCVRAKRCRPR